jgi:hypothetical protein
MVVFNLIYQGYTHDHKKILLLGLGVYALLLSGVYSEYIPIPGLNQNVSQLVKKYGWVLVLIDYLVLNLLHYFQTGTYLFRQPQKEQLPVIKNTPEKYVAWGKPDPEQLYHRSEPQLNKQVIANQHNSQNLMNNTHERTPVQQHDERESVQSNEPPFDPNYVLDDEDDSDDEEPIIENQPKIVDQYAMKKPNTAKDTDDDLSESISSE